MQDQLRDYGMTGSMSRKGHCRENRRSAVSRAVRREGEARHNAPTERRFNRFKNERMQGVSFASHADMRAVSFKYTEVFSNRKRQHSTLGHRSPVQFLAHWIGRQHQEKLVA
ncbi:MAG: IS3 family transposase [Candidatus Accumulibacter sp.]|nr:IS3 family transposase [Accumulibacter sp.]